MEECLTAHCYLSQALSKDMMPVNNHQNKDMLPVSDHQNEV